MSSVLKFLTIPSAPLETAFYKMAKDYRDSDDWRYYKDVIREGFDFKDYLTRHRQNALGVDLEEGLVPFTTFWLIDDKVDTVYGVSRLRHRLNKISRKEGGHIGYDVPPSLRGLGNATEILRLTIIKAKEMGILRALLTCDADNIASVRVIEKNSGMLENQIVSDYTGKVVNRYWINC